MVRRLAVLALGVILVGCSFRGTAPAASSPTPTATATPSPTATATPTPTPTATPTPTPTPSPTPVVYRSTLTGEVMSAPPPRPIAVQIDNAPPARLQTGLIDADLVYETPTEAALTRFTAFYQTQAPDVVGPVRSARLIDLQVIPEHDAMLAYSGASIGVQARLVQAGLNLLAVEDNAAPAGRRDPQRYAPYNLYTSIPKLRQVATGFGWSRTPTAQSFAFGPAPAGGETSSGVTIPYSYGNVEFTYNSSTNSYDRFMAGEPHRDAVTGKQISPRNVVVLFATFTETSIIEDVLGARSLDVKLQGSGNAWIFRDGKRYQAQWQRSGVNEILRFVDPSTGQRVALAEGQTWICLVPQWLSAAPKP